MNKRVREIIKNKTGVALDQPDSTGAEGTTTTGNAARKFLFEAEKRQMLVDCIHKRSEKMINVIRKCMPSFLQIFLSS